MLKPSSAITLASLVTGAGLGAYLGYNKAERDELDTSDKFGYATMSGLLGAGVGLGVRAIGANGLFSGAIGGVKGLNTTRKLLFANPVKDFLIKNNIRTTYGYKAIPKIARGPLLGLAILAGGIGAVAYSARSKPETKAYSSIDNTGQTSYSGQSVKERMGMLGAIGDVVFGLHNTRHG